MKKFKLKYINYLLIVFLVSINLISFTFGKYATTLNKKITLNINSSSYIVIFHSNNGLGEEVTQEFSIGESKRLTLNTFENNDLGFAGWNTEIDGSGDRYGDGALVTNLASNPNEVVHLYAQWSDGVALYNGESFGSISAAVSRLTGTGTIVLLQDTSDYVTIPSGKNVTLDIGNHTVGNSTDNNPIFEVNGVLNISGGNISSTAQKAGAINVRNGGILNISGGNVVNTGDRQAIYVDKGTVNISGDTYLENTGSARAALQIQASSSATITGGTIISRSTNAIQNSGTLVIGTKDSNPNSSIVARGHDYGLTTTTNVNYYDGVIYGENKAINNVSKIVDKEISCMLLTTENEVIDGKTYNKAYLVKGVTITFNPNGGTVSETSRTIISGNAIGSLPTPSRVDYKFLGWYTDPVDGIKIESDTIIDSDVTYYAHWKANTSEVARIGDNTYNSIQDAIDACPSGVSTTITILKNVRTILNVDAGKDIIIDLDNHTLTANSGSKALFEKSGNLTIQNGTLNSNNGASTINNNAGYLKLDNVTINSQGEKQSLYIAAGTVEITGNSYLSSETSGVSSLGVLPRGTVHVMSGAQLTIDSATIIGTQGNGISNEGGIVTLGVKDGTIDNTSIIIQAKREGIETTSTFNFYDGIIKGYVETINGTITAQEDNSHTVDGTEVIGTDTYKTKYLELD